MDQRAHYERSQTIAATVEAAFDFIDDHEQFSAHMGQSSWMTGGGKMTVDMDDQRGRSVGSHIRMSGSAFGLQITLDEVVTERIPPRRKVWRTVGVPRLVVIGFYEMGFDLSAVDQGSALRVWINYELPPRGLGRLLPALGDAYARWCVEQMARDAVRAFGRLAVPAGDPAEQSN